MSLSLRLGETVFSTSSFKLLKECLIVICIKVYFTKSLYLPLCNTYFESFLKQLLVINDFLTI